MPYTLGALESAQSVAERFGISVAELRKLNQFRTFARGFDNVRQGDELDVPAQVSENNLTPPPGNSSGNLEQQIASTSQQIGSLLAEDMNSEQAANMARGWASSQASGAMTDWLSRFGTARITLGVDEDFSLKNSQFDFLHPWYETPDNLFFSQHTLHRTDERTQINNGLGWRHFTPTWMSGINFFFDHDLSRYHSRAGISAEYWRDYLKLSSNGYLRLTNWRSAPELDNDYEARPANGWDVRAEGWLPAWPHLGGKLVYEQYYGDEVALFDKDDRQSNPHAITAGLNYTPFPLMTFSAEQRQGKQGENDTRFAVDFTWLPGSAMQKQLDPNEVAARRSLAGSRYDLVDRNNNIVLEYRKKELVRLTLTDPVTGKSGEVKSLVSSLQTKYALKGYNVEATALEAAGGKVVTTGKDILVTLPAYRFTSTPETDNTWPIEVTAEDVKGNLSNREQSMVVVQAPTLSQKDSSVSLSTQTLNADSHSTATLTFIAHDAAGNPVIGLVLSTRHEGVQDITLSDWKDNGDGSYTQVLTTGAMSGTLTLMPQLNGVDAAKAPAVVNIISVSSSRTHSSIKIDKDRYLSGNPIEVTVELRDENDRPVKEQKQQLNTAVSIDNVKPGVTTDWKETADGVYKATYTAYTRGSGLTAKLLMQNWNEDLHTAGFIIDANPQSAKIATLSASNNGVLANENAANTVSVNVADEGSNPINDHTVTFAVLSGSATSFNNQNTAKTDVNGLATFDLKSSKQEDNTVEVTLENGVKQTLIVSFVGDSSTAQVELQMSKDEITGNGVDNATLTATVKDQFDNEVNNLPVTFSSASSGLTLTPGVSNTNESGIAQATLAGVAFGEQTVTASLANNGASDNKTVHFIGDTAAAKIIELTPVPDSIIAGTPQNSSGSVITATVVDNNGFPVKGVTVNFTSRTNSAEMTNGGQAVTNEQGKATVTYTNTRSSIESGARPDTVEASLENGSSTLSTSINVNADASTAHLTLLQALFDTVSAGDTTNLYIEVKDNYGNGVPQQEVTLRVSPSEGVTPSNNAIYTTNHDGNFYTSFTATKAGVYQVTATLENGDSMQQTVTYVPNVANAEITLAASKDPVIADNNDLTTLTATVADTEGNAIANTEVTFTLPEDVRANFTLSDGGKAITDTEGKAKVTLKGIKAGAHTVTASMAGSKSGQLVVNFTADTLTAQVNLNVTEDNFIANNIGMTKLQATVTDGNGNPFANEAVTFTLPADVSASFTLGQGGSAITDINGKAEVTLSGTKSGTYPVTVSVINYGVSDTKQVTLIADAGTATLASLTSVYSFVVSTTEGATMTASVTDANGNPVEGIKVNFRGTSVTLSSTSVETDDQGFAEILVTSTEVGLKTVSASLADKPTEVISRLLNAKADINSATITSLEIPEGQLMVAQDVAVKAHVNDQFGNPILNESVTFSAEPPEHMTISQNIVSTDTHGIAEVSMTPERNGSYMVKASLANGASLEKQLEAIDEKLTLTASSPLIGVYAPTGTTLTATLTSANGTPVEGQVINFSVTPEGATLSGGKVRTNSSGQAPVVLTSNKVGTYTVTASFHNGVTIQTQTTVKVTGNSSTAHVASFIADPSTIAATNSDLSTLKATVEDGSGNLIEGLTVYFALKSGSATLTSLTAVTDQNGIATTSVKGAMTGSVTVSAVTTAGGMQTVDITLVAGPADASQSVLKNNRSSLKGDFTDSAELHLVLHDISGNPIKVSEGMEFVQSGTNVPYMKISAIDYSLNINGDYKATVTGGGEGIATLIPVLNGVHQAGLSTTIQFTRAEDKIMSGTVSVNGTDLPTTTFPSQGFTGAYYQLNNDNFAPGKTAADYEFSSSASWVDVDATGKVTFKNVGSNWERITATPKSGGPSYVYEIRVKSWWVNSGDAFMIYSLAENFCSSNGYTLPRADHLNHSRSRGIGSLYSEWGDMGHYTTDAGFQSNMYWSSSPANSSEQYVVSLATGDQSVFEKLGFAYATCYKNL